MMGSFSETAMIAVDELRKQDRKVGLVRFRLWRPFPLDELLLATKDAETIIVLDRCLSFGTHVGPVCSEVRAALSAQERKPNVVGFIGGLGGRDITVAQFMKMVDSGLQAAKRGKDEIEMVGVIE
jgi:pyruvate ferredoxin oxidoreductase alpha subunit